MTREERDKAIRILQWLHDNYFLFRSTEEDVKYHITGRSDGATCSELGDYVMETIEKL